MVFRMIQIRRYSFSMNTPFSLIRSILLLAVIHVGLSVAARSEEKETPKPVEPAATTPAEPAPTTAYAPTDLERLKLVKDKVAIVEGKVAATGENKAKSIRYLNYTKNFSESVSLVFFVAKDPTTFSRETLQTYVGKKVRATGTISEHRGSLQMVIDRIDQLQIVPETTAEPAPAAPEPAK